MDSNRCVVRVSGFDGDLELGSCLGEAEHAEEAEDRARERLIKRLDKATEDSRSMHQKERPRAAPAPAPAKHQNNKPIQQDGRDRQDSVELNEAQPTTIAEPNEAPTDPEDWSDELTAIDVELKRIGWNRDQEKIYLERAYGNGSRHKLTRYSDLVSFLSKLKSLETGIEPQIAPVPLRRSDLIMQGDEILKSLNWTQKHAKEFLQSQLGATSRQHLSAEQLLQFNILLEEKLITATP